MQVITLANAFLLCQFIQGSDGEVTTGNKNKPINKPMTPLRNKLRLQDKELQEVVDNGMCLSMHQPWASLLTHGIKMCVCVFM